MSADALRARIDPDRVVLGPRFFTLDEQKQLSLLLADMAEELNPRAHWTIHPNPRCPGCRHEELLARLASLVAEEAAG